MTVPMKRTKEVVIDEDLNIPYRDSGTWRSYQLMTHGYTVQELIDTADIVELNRDGDMIDWYPMGEGHGEVEEAGIELINTEWKETQHV